VHGVASGANSAIFGVAIVWLAVNHGSAAVFAVFEGRSVNHLRSLKGNLKCHAYVAKKPLKKALSFHSEPSFVERFYKLHKQLSQSLI
jgi:hypothetical protein